MHNHEIQAALSAKVRVSGEGCGFLYQPKKSRKWTILKEKVLKSRLMKVFFHKNNYRDIFKKTWSADMAESPQN